MYADVIIDISHEKIDNTFQYKIPEELYEDIEVGSVVRVPFGRSKKNRKGFVVGFSTEPKLDPERIKDVCDVDKKDLSVESHLIVLARWMKRRYGGTLSAALKTVLPVKRRVKKRATNDNIKDAPGEKKALPPLNAAQREVCERFNENFRQRRVKTYLLFGVTGSGKTRVYIEMTRRVISEGRSVILLIPEIALTRQNIMRFESVFAGEVGVLHSRLSEGKRYEVYEKAKDGRIKIILGPRSALFAPFLDIGLIIVDEEHETSYKSEQVPKYNSIEVAIERGRLCGASVVLGSATPDIGSMLKAKNNEYELLQLKERTKAAKPPVVTVVDMRDELKSGNTSMLSSLLMQRIEQTLHDRKQIMLFLNRRGLAGFVSCRSCGHVLKCPHCDVSLHQHKGGLLRCHYCGYQMHTVHSCPECGSKYIGGFKAGTQSVEALLGKLYPNTKVLRMDADTTKGRGGHEKILSHFGAGEADILLGTQMIVKGHDFPNVTLVGVLAADLSLNDSDYMSAERTFDLLLQAAGRAGRGEYPGECVIQTYSPGHYAIKAAAAGDYDAFYEREMAYRRLMVYPPVGHMLLIQIVSRNADEGADAAGELAGFIKRTVSKVKIAGPSEASISKIKDQYRFAIYLKAELYDTLIQIKDSVEELSRSAGFAGRYPYSRIFFDFDPVGVF